MVSVLHKELEYKVIKLSGTKNLGVMQPRIRIKSEPPVGEYTIRNNPHEVLQSLLINTIYNLLVKNNLGRGGALEREGGLSTFFPEKRGAA